MQADQPGGESVPSSVTNPEEAPKAIFIAYLKLEGAAPKPAFSAVVSHLTEAITKLGSVDAKLTHWHLVLDPHLVKEVRVAIVDALHMAGENGQCQAEEK